MSQVKQQLSIKEQLLILVENTLDKQNEKGMSKYNITLDECPSENYNWSEMIIEELIDALQYSVKENNKQRVELDETKAENLRLRQTMDHMYSTVGE